MKSLEEFEKVDKHRYETDEIREIADELEKLKEALSYHQETLEPMAQRWKIMAWLESLESVDVELKTLRILLADLKYLIESNQDALDYQ